MLPPVPERPHLIAPEPHRPRRRRVAAPGEPLGRRPGTVEGHEKEFPRPGGGTPLRLVPLWTPLLVLRDQGWGEAEKPEKEMSSPPGAPAAEEQKANFEGMR